MEYEELADEVIVKDGQEFKVEYSTGLVHMDNGDKEPIILSFDEIEFIAEHLLQSQSINL